MLIQPDMPYSDLLGLAAERTNPVAPGLLKARFIQVQGNVVSYDRFLSLAQTEGPDSPRVRKVMLLVWALRDSRLRGFILERLADSRGKWKPSEVGRKSNADYFVEQGSSSGAKIRSNIERFLEEARIYSPSKKSIDLDFSDGWLVEAMLVAGQHAATPEIRNAIHRDPIRFLFDHSLNGLANLARGELELTSVEQSLTMEAVEESIAQDWSTEPSQLRDWAPRDFRPGRGRKTTVDFDPIALERANAAHLRLEQIAWQAAKSLGLTPQCSLNLDMVLNTPHGQVLLEMKSCTQRNFLGQIRRAVSQLLEYRYTYRFAVGGAPTLVIVAEIPPPRSKEWVADYLQSIGMTLIWKRPRETQLVTTLPVPRILEGIVSPA